MKQKELSDDRRRQVETTKRRYGEDYFKKLGQKSGSFRDPQIARNAVNKRWHPEWFDENGNLIEEYKDANQKHGQPHKVKK